MQRTFDGMLVNQRVRKNMPTHVCWAQLLAPQLAPPAIDQS
jgi:hypothetical protein